MTPEWCVGKCKLAGYKYAGLQYGYLCFCGDRFGTYGKVDDAECDSLCFGDKTRYCGAFWHNSIFSVGKSSTRNEKVLSCSITQNKFPIQTCNMNSGKRKINATNIPKKNFPHSNTLWSFFSLTKIAKSMNHLRKTSQKSKKTVDQENLWKSQKRNMVGVQV